jgi:hypothetical protein
MCLSSHVNGNRGIDKYSNVPKRMGINVLLYKIVGRVAQSV